MVCIAQYDKDLNVIGFVADDGRNFSTDHLPSLEHLGADIQYKTLVELDDLAEKNRIASIKAKAGEIILLRLPYWKQNNLQSRRVELKELVTPTQNDLDEIAAIDIEWQWAKGIRTISDTAEANGTLLKDINWGV